ncbi:hypothetical protein B5F85_08305 [Olsenella sp. An293]|nr:hypothetical protein B5F85_08305 [Olsenella sp. An293]
MAGRTPIPVSRAMRTIAANLDLALRQQRITLELLAEGALAIGETASRKPEGETRRARRARRPQR